MKLWCELLMLWLFLARVRAYGVIYDIVHLYNVFSRKICIVLMTQPKIVCK